SRFPSVAGRASAARSPSLSLGVLQRAGHRTASPMRTSLPREGARFRPENEEAVDPEDRPPPLPDADAYLQKPSMQILPAPQVLLALGSHSPPRFELEPQTSCWPDEV